MRPKLYFSTMNIRRGNPGEVTSVPDLLGGLILQNELEFCLDEEDEIFEGYGRCFDSYPYRQLSCYSRKLEESSIKTAVLENDYLKAVFLPELGGRLWILWDKQKNRNLLYTNDVLRYSNLAIRNAWFSGGVEWNISIVGHTPFTTEPLFTAELEDEEGNPVLRMYEYERVRQVTYQMDFWLGEQDRFLNARMRSVNFGEQVVPMYWWSNIAVPEHDKGRIIVPAKKAYTNHDGCVYKVDVPIVDGNDITRYQNIPESVDYFFEIGKTDPKYIANVDAQGYGLLHLSTDRLQSRKLFSWGGKRAADHWQEFLTDKAGRYVEIQAGLGKTQYGCIPMAPHTAWEWMERYGALQLEQEDLDKSFEELNQKVTAEIKASSIYQEMNQVLADKKQMAKTPAKLWQKGSGYGALKNIERQELGKAKISEHLDFGSCEEQQEIWAEFLKTGVLGKVNAACPPPSFMSDEIYFKRLLENKEKNKENWYAQYQIGIFWMRREEYGRAEKELLQSLICEENAWAYHGLSCLYTLTGDSKKAAANIEKGMRLQKQDISYVKEGIRLLSINKEYEKIRELYNELDDVCQMEGRIRFYYIQALAETGYPRKAYDLLCEKGGLIVGDVREGEELVGEVFKELHKELYGEEGELPYVFDFKAVS